MFSRFPSIAGLALVLAAPAVGAQAIIAAGSGLASPAQTITFEGQTGGSVANTQYSGQGVTFGPNLSYNTSGYFNATGGARASLDNFSAVGGCGACATPTDIFFSTAINGAAFQFITNSGTSTFTALLAGNSVYAFSAATSTAGINTVQWYGFDTTISFDQINIQSGGSNSAFALDNLETGAVSAPEPASLTLLATGLVGMFGVARRRRNRAV